MWSPGRFRPPNLGLLYTQLPPPVKALSGQGLGPAVRGGGPGGILPMGLLELGGPLTHYPASAEALRKT